MKALRLKKLVFDNLENRNGESVEVEKIFVDIPDGDNAHSLLNGWVAAQPPEKRYLGWNCKVYPIYVVEHIRVN
jgi:hypothetical protein